MVSCRVLVGDAAAVLRGLPDASVHCCVTSPPYYGLRDYGVAGQIGLEPTLDAYVARLVAVFREVRRVLRPDGTLWLVLGDSYGRGSRSLSRDDGKRGAQARQAWGHYPALAAKHPEKQLLGVPWRVAFALQADGWILRSDIVWAKPNALPESVRDRPTRAHEFVFLFARSPRYRYDAAAIAEPAALGDPRRPRGSAGSLRDGRPAPHAGRRAKQDGVGKAIYTGFNARWAARGAWPATRNRRDVWTVPAAPHPDASEHFATFPEALVAPMILAGCPEGGMVLDPFAGSGTTLAVANRLGRHAIGVELNPAYAAIIRRRCRQAAWTWGEVPDHEIQGG
ncbi:MAG: site-specific DNA-methyltransferase [Firmicutes bacterium]|nr:site-specific DNA-methyltransferase [Bacillota bacterium]